MEYEFLATLSNRDIRGLMFFTLLMKVGGSLGVGDTVGVSCSVYKRENLFRVSIVLLS